MRVPEFLGVPSVDGQSFLDRKAGIARRLRLIRARADRSALAAGIDQEPEPSPSSLPDREINAQVAFTIA
jgi:hypothetical protein